MVTWVFRQYLERTLVVLQTTQILQSRMELVQPPAKAIP